MKKYGTLTQYKKLCAQIWKEKQGICENCGLQLKEPRYHNFHHTIGRRKNFLNKSTIRLLCFQCHSKAEGIEEKATWLDN